MHQLCDVSFGELSNCFKFDDNDSFDDQIRFIRSDRMPAKPNRDWDLLFDPKPLLAKSDNHRLLVNRFEKSKPKLIVHVIEDSNNGISQLLVQKTFFHRLLIRAICENPRQKLLMTSN